LAQLAWAKRPAESGLHFYIGTATSLSSGPQPYLHDSSLTTGENRWGSIVHPKEMYSPATVSRPTTTIASAYFSDYGHENTGRSKRVAGENTTIPSELDHSYYNYYARATYT